MERISELELSVTDAGLACLFIIYQLLMHDFIYLFIKNDISK